MAGKTAVLAVKILGDAKSATRGFGTASTGAKRFGAAAARAGKIAAAALAIGVAIAARALFGMVKAAAADQKAQVLLANTLRNTAGATRNVIGSVEKWITKQGVLLGITDDELRPALSKLAVATGSVTKSQRLARLAMNVSAGAGKSLDAVSGALAKAYNGNIGALGRLGIATKNAKGETLTFKQVTAQLEEKFKGSASKAANTFEGKMGRLKVVFDETKEAVGAKLIPILSSMGTWFLEKGLPAIKKLSAEFSEKFGPTLKKVGEFIRDKILPVLQDLGAFVKDKVIPAWREFGEHVLAGVKKFIDNVSKSLADNKPFLDQAWKNLKKIGEIILTKVLPAIGRFAEWFLPKLGTAIGKMITISKKLINAFLNLAIFGTKSFRILLTAAFNTFSGILHAADAALGWLPKWGKKIGEAKESFDKFKDKTTANLKAVEDGLRKIKENINAIPEKKTIHINVVTTATGAKIPIGGAHGGPGLPIEPRPTTPRVFTEPGTSGRSTTNITIQGAVDPRGTAVQIQKILTARVRQRGGRGAGLGRGWSEVLVG